MQTNVLIEEECILKNRNKSCPYKKLSVFYNSCLKIFGSHLVYHSVCTLLDILWSSILISSKMQHNAGVSLLQNHSTCFGCPSHPSSGVHQTVTAVSGMGIVSEQQPSASMA